MNLFKNMPDQNISGKIEFAKTGGLGILVVVIIAIIFISTVKFGQVTGETVGVLLNKINGKMQVINQPGKKMYNGFTHRFYTLDKTLQTLEMTEVVGRGDQKGKDDLKIKTVDGSDVYVDLKVQYKIDPTKADVVLKTSGYMYGKGSRKIERYKLIWVRDYVRSYTRNYLGELTTEEFYDSTKRDTKIREAKDAAQMKLKDYGIVVDRISIPKEPHFYKEYEDMIRKKKTADQAVLEEESKALAAQQRQQTLIVEENNKMNVEVERYEGLMEQRIIEAKATAQKITLEADAYYERLSREAEAVLYQNEQVAIGIRALKSKEAEGIKEMKKALEGEGGRNMVKLEYARKLKNITIVGQPYSIDSDTRRLQHNYGVLDTRSINK